MSQIEEIVVIDRETVDKCDPHGYFSNHGRHDVNFKSPTKRSFLNECIRQIYILNDSEMPMSNQTVVYNRCLIWNTLNALMAPQKVSRYQASVQKVKRRLFREPKQNKRKGQHPTRNIIMETECFAYKLVRPQVGVKRMPRNYLDQARQMIQQELRPNLKRKYVDESLHLSTKDGTFQVSQQVMSKVCRYHGNMARHHPQRERSMEEQLKRERNTEACRLNRRAKKLEEMLVEQQYRERLMANEKVLEASIRSILYMKALMGLMVSNGPQDEHDLYI